MEWKFKKSQIKDHQTLINDLNAKGYFQGFEDQRYVYSVPYNEYMPDTAIMLYDNGIAIEHPMAYVEGTIDILTQELPDGISAKSQDIQSLEDTDLNTYKSLNETRAISAINFNNEILMSDIIAFKDSPNFNVINVNQFRQIINSSGYTDEPIDIPDFQEIDEKWEDWFDDYLEARDYLHDKVQEKGLTNLTQSEKEIASKWRVVLQSDNVLSKRVLDNTKPVFEKNKAEARQRRFGNVYGYGQEILSVDDIHNMVNKINEFNFTDDYINVGRMGSDVEMYDKGGKDAEGIGDFIVSRQGTQFENNGLAESLNSITGTQLQQFIGAVYNMIITGKWA